MRVPRRGRAACLIVGTVLSACPAHVIGGSRRHGETTPQAPQTTLTAIRLTGDAGRPIVELTASNALPEPVVGVLHAPSRIYLDLADVRIGARVPGEGLGAVTRVRAAIHSVSPLVTRVVIDLSEARDHMLDVSQRRSGVIRISIGPAEERHTATSTRASTTSDAVPTPGRQYRAQVAPVVAQLQPVVRVLESIDRRTAVPLEDLDGAAQTIATVRNELSAMQPTRDATVVHDTLRSACTLASMAVSLARAANGRELPWNASSAAAGSLLLLDRARGALQPR